VASDQHGSGRGALQGLADNSHRYLESIQTGQKRELNRKLKGHHERQPLSYRISSSSSTPSSVYVSGCSSKVILALSDTK